MERERGEREGWGGCSQWFPVAPSGSFAAGPPTLEDIGVFAERTGHPDVASRSRLS